jgi:hypothetical protein
MNYLTLIRMSDFQICMVSESNTGLKTCTRHVPSLRQRRSGNRSVSYMSLQRRLPIKPR